MRSYRKILSLTLLVVMISTSSICLAAGIFSPEAKKDFTALGTEPFWSVNIFTDDIVVFSTPEGAIGFVYEAPVIYGKEYRYNLKNKVLLGLEISMQIIITEEKTADSMAGQTYPYKAKINLGGKTYEGVAYIDKKTIDCEKI